MLELLASPDADHMLDYRIVYTTWGGPLVARRFANRTIANTWEDLETLAGLLQADDPEGSAVTVITVQLMNG